MFKSLFETLALLRRGGGEVFIGGIDPALIIFILRAVMGLNLLQGFELRGDGARIFVEYFWPYILAALIYKGVDFINKPRDRAGKRS